MDEDCKKLELENLLINADGNNSCTWKKKLNLPEKPSKSSKERVGRVVELLNKIKFIIIEVWIIRAQKSKDFDLICEFLKLVIKHLQL
jgi:hypothetical protein